MWQPWGLGNEYLPLKNQAEVQQHNLLGVCVKCEICILSRSLADLYTHYSFLSAAQICGFQCEAPLPVGITWQNL